MMLPNGVDKSTGRIIFRDKGDTSFPLPNIGKGYGVCLW
jgi:ribosomal protein L27